MNFQFYTVHGGPLTFHQEAPKKYKSKLIKGSEIFYTKGDFGEILLQRIKLRSLAAWYFFLHIRKKETFRITYHKPLLLAHIRLQNDLKVMLNDFPGTTIIKEEQFNFLNNAQLDMLWTVCQDHDYESLNIIFPGQMLEDYLITGGLPFLKPFLLPVRELLPALMVHGEVWFEKKVKELFNSIVYLTYAPEILPYHQAIKLQSILVILLQEANEAIGEQEGTLIHPRPGAIPEKILMVKSLIDKSFPRKVTMAEMRKATGLEKYMIHRGFRKAFSMSTLEYQFLCKMNYVMKLRTEGKSIKEIRIALRAKSESLLIRQFKMNFGFDFIPAGPPLQK